MPITKTERAEFQKSWRDIKRRIPGSLSEREWTIAEMAAWRMWLAMRLREKKARRDASADRAEVVGKVAGIIEDARIKCDQLRIARSALNESTDPRCKMALDDMEDVK
jgi:hypothetical protein